MRVKPDRWVRSRPRAILLGLGLLVIGYLLSFGLAATTHSAARFGSGTTNDPTGTADVLGCERVGPVGPDGLGFWTHCTARIQMDTGQTYDAIQFGRSELNRRDLGHEVRVRHVTSGRGEDRWVRLDGHKPPAVVSGLLLIVMWVLGVAGVVAGLIGALLLLLATVAALVGKPNR